MTQTYEASDSSGELLVMETEPYPTRRTRVTAGRGENTGCCGGGEIEQYCDLSFAIPATTEVCSYFFAQVILLNMLGILLFLQDMLGLILSANHLYIGTQSSNQ